MRCARPLQELSFVAVKREVVGENAVACHRRPQRNINVFLNFLFQRSDGLYTRKFRDKIAITLPNRRMQPLKESPVTGEFERGRRHGTSVRRQRTFVTHVGVQSRLSVRVCNKCRSLVLV
jgi:hypothetical protein